jgi:hypothetical protein
VWLAFLFLIPVTFTMSTYHMYTWSLIALGFVPNAAVLLLYIVFDASIRPSDGRRKSLQLLGLTTMLLILFPNRVLLAIPPILLVAVFALLVERRARKAIVASVLAVLLGLAAKTAAFEIVNVGSGTKYSVTALPLLITRMAVHPMDYARLFEVGIGSGFFNLRTVNGLLGLEIGSLGLAHGAAALYLSALVLFFRKAMWRTSFVPVLMMTYPLLVIAGIGIYRYDPEVNSYWASVQPRHIVMLVFASVGACWVFVLALLQQKGKSRASVASRGAILCALILVLATQLLLARESWRIAPLILEEREQHERLIRSYAKGRRTRMPHWITGYNFPDPFVSSLSFLQERELNLYSRNWKRTVRSRRR